MPPLHFVVFIIVSVIAFLGILAWTLRGRAVKPAGSRIAAVALVVVVAGMLFARFGAMAGLPWHVYYGAPALVTLLLPPLAFRMRRDEWLWYLGLAFLASPAIHLVFSFFFGWHEYLPFWHIPSLWSLAQPGT